MRFTIYCHTNKINGKKYVGQTRYTIGRRWAQHVAVAEADRATCRVLAAAIRKYGSEAFTHEVLDVVMTQEGANIAEGAWIKHLQCLVPHGYNLNAYGEGSTAHPETRQKKSENAKRIWAAMAPEERNARSHNGVTAMYASLSSQQRRENVKRFWQSLSPEQRAVKEARLREMAAAGGQAGGFSTPEKAIAAQRIRWDKATAQQRLDQTENARVVMNSKTSEQRRLAGLKAWETRRTRGTRSQCSVCNQTGHYATTCKSKPNIPE